MKIKPAIADAEMRRRAEVELVAHPRSNLSASAQSKADVSAHRLLHELEVHQIELEMQNTELRMVRGELEASLENYTDLYDFSPVGYFTLAADGTVQQVNLTGAILVGVERDRLVGRGFDELLPAGLQPQFQSFLKKAFAGPAKQSDDFEILRPGQSHRSINLEARCLLNQSACRVVAVDITARKLAEDKVRVSEIRYRRLFETAHDGVLLLDPRTRKITDANPFMSELLGCSHAQLIGQELFEIGLHQDELASQEMFQKMKHDREVRYDNLPLKSRDGRTQEVEVVANLYQEADHDVIQCNIRDVTARKRTERELAEKARLLDLSHDAIIVRDMQGHVRYWNRGAEELYGWSRQEAMGKISHVLLKTEFPIPLKQMTEELHRTDRWSGELVHTKRDGERVTVLTRKTLDRDSEGKQLAVLENITDITARKLAEARLRDSEQLFRAMADAISQLAWIAQPDGSIFWYNQRWYDYTGKTAKQMTGWGWQKVHDAAELPKVLEQWKACLASGQPFEMTFPLRGADGRFRSFLTRAVPLKNARGVVVQWFGTNTDVEGLKQAEAAQRRNAVLAASNQKLEAEIIRRQAVEKSLKHSQQLQAQLLVKARQMQEELRRLSRDVLRVQEEERKHISRELHDVIAQTLTGINPLLECLKQTARHDLASFDRYFNRTQRLVSKSVGIIHEFARELRPSVLDDLGLIPALHTFMKDFAKRTGIHTRLTAFAGVEKMHSAKRTTLFRIAQEALTNVSRHARASRVKIKIQKSADGIVMKVQDNGISFSPKKQLRIKGVKSLGLLGMRERVQMVGGTFDVKSSPKNGTTIQATLPFGKPRAGGHKLGRKTIKLK